MNEVATQIHPAKIKNASLTFTLFPPRLLPLQVPQLDRAVGGARGQADVGQLQRDAGLWTEDYRPHVGVVTFSQSRRGVEGREEDDRLQ